MVHQYRHFTWIVLFVTCFALLAGGTASAFTANSFEITIDENGDAIAVFSFTLEGFLENAIPQPMLEEELLKGLGTSSEPPELVSMDRSTATLRMKKFAATSDVPTGTEYRTVSMNFNKAQIALDNSALSSVVTADFSPATMKVRFPDAYERTFVDSEVLPSITHIIVDPEKAAANSVTAGPTVPPTDGMVRIISQPDGVSVAIDGEYKGNAPDTFMGIPPGLHQFTFSREHYQPVSREIDVQAGQTVQVSVHLAPDESSSAKAPGFIGILAVLALVFCITTRVRGYQDR